MNHNSSATSIRAQRTFRSKRGHRYRVPQTKHAMVRYHVGSGTQRALKPICHKERGPLRSFCLPQRHSLSPAAMERKRPTGSFGVIDADNRNVRHLARLKRYGETG